MATPVQEARNRFDVKKREASTILDNPNSTAAEIKTAQEIIRVDLPAIKTEIELLDSTSSLKSALGDYSQWMNDPAEHQPNNVKTIGWQPSGFSQFGQDGKKSVLYSEGEGLMTEAQIKTIQQPAYHEAFKTYLRAKGDLNKLPSDSIKTLSEGIDEDGGYLVPAEILQRIIERAATPTRIAGMVSSLTTSRDVLVLPKTNYSADDIYTTGIRVKWTGERGKPGQADNPKFGTMRFPVYTAMLALNATNDLLEDTGFGLLGWIGSKFSETVDILRDEMALKGSGVGQPTGMLTGAGQPDKIQLVKSGNANELTADALVAMSYAIPEQYMDNCRWLMNRTNTEQRVALLKDKQDRYLFAGGRESDTLANSRPDTMLGFGLTRSALMPNVEANKIPVLFGDASGYYQVTRVGFSIRILTELQAMDNETVVLGRVRFGGDMAEPWKMRGMQVKA
jgi:HK97 family phage major capsid protein